MMVALHETTPSFIEMALRRGASALANKREKRVTAGIAQAVFRFVMHIAGFSCLTIAGFALHFAIGMTVAALSCFALSFLMTSDNTTNERHR